MRRARSVALCAAVAVAATSCAQSSLSDRQRDVARRGAQIMPFDLERTTHHFEPTPFGGVQTVVADDPNDNRQIRLIRRHLRAEAGRFRNGDFGDPAAIHGHEMPGLRELSAGFEEIGVGFATTPSGARLTYRTTTPRLVEALHRWFEAQLMDHGDHARRGG